MNLIAVKVVIMVNELPAVTKVVSLVKVVNSGEGSMNALNIVIGLNTST